MNAAQVDLQQLRIKHILFKSKVRSALYGGEYDEAFFSVSGPVSAWFNTIGFTRYGREPEIRELSHLHQELNILARQLFTQYKNGQIDQAHEGLRTVDKKSEAFINLIIQLENRLKDSSSIYSI